MHETINLPSLNLCQQSIRGEGNALASSRPCKPTRLDARHGDNINVLSIHMVPSKWRLSKHSRARVRASLTTARWTCARRGFDSSPQPHAPPVSYHGMTAARVLAQEQRMTSAREEIPAHGTH